MAKKLKELMKEIPCKKCGMSPCKCKHTVKEAVDKNEDNHMFVSLLKSTVMNAERLLDMVKDDSDLPEWCHHKISLAQDYIDTVTNYMETEEE